MVLFLVSLRFHNLVGLIMRLRSRLLVPYTFSEEMERTMPNRVVCSVLDEMRKCHETRNYSYLMGLIEEVQVMVNRMEAALYDQYDLEHARKKYKELKIEVEALEEKKKFLEEKS